MTAFSKIDMREVTRLTRAGKLDEAMALLKGGSQTPAAESTPRAWTESLNPEGARNGARARPDFAETLQKLGAHLPKMGDYFGKGVAPQAPLDIPNGARFEERIYSNAAGSRSYKIYVPSGCTGQGLPLVVMLHGCTQNPDDFAAGTGMNEVAEEQKFLVAYPHQPKSANLKKCWNWFNAEDQQRDVGEPSLIAGIALQAIAEFGADSRRVYVAGLSAGGAAAAILAATYPDIFAAVGVHSGLACGAARDMRSAFAAMAGNGATPRRIGGPVVPTIVFHGDADRTVNAANGEQIAEQIRQSAALTDVVTHGESAGGVAFTRIAQRDAAGRAVLEQWVLHGLGHAWSGGSARGSFTDPRGPDASREMVRFFLKQANTTISA